MKEKEKSKARDPVRVTGKDARRYLKERKLPLPLILVLVRAVLAREVEEAEQSRDGSAEECSNLTARAPGELTDADILSFFEHKAFPVEVISQLAEHVLKRELAETPQSKDATGEKQSDSGKESSRAKHSEQGEPAARQAPEGEQSEEEQSPAPEATSVESKARPSEVRASPGAVKLAAEKEVDLADVKPGGQINKAGVQKVTKKDVEEHLAKPAKGAGEKEQGPDGDGSGNGASGAPQGEGVESGSEPPE